MRNIAALSIFFSGFGALSACSVDPLSQAEGQEGTRSDELVGGRVATEAEYPSTVSLGGCTGVKVGPRHFLSAAHCFGNPNQQVLTMTPDNAAQNFVNLTVSAIHIHPEWTNCTACAGDGSMNDFGFRPDVALIVVEELTPNVPAAVIDASPVAIGDAVTLTGYGCENGVGQPSGPARFKVGDTATDDPLTLSDAPSIPLGYVTTWGPELEPSAPGLCPGDSGGPLFRTGTNRVVGINALVSFNGATGNPFGNWFTRLDNQSRYDIWGWLNGLMSSQGTNPCAGICQPATTFASRWFSSGNLGTGARCFETTASPIAGSCGGFVSPRTLSINGTPVACGGESWTLPAKRNGGYCFSVSAGQNAWAWFQTW